PIGESTPVTTNVNTATRTNTRSAIGSISAPQRLVHFPRRAIQPSRKSVRPASPTNPSRALASPDAAKAAARKTRDDEMMFGRARSPAREAMRQSYAHGRLLASE